MFKAIQIKNSKLFLRYIFGDNDVHLTISNPMFYTDDKYLERDIERLKTLGIETEIKVFEIKEKDLIDKSNK